MGSWSYPEPGLVRIAGVPLFSGFMYASVGSYLARAIRIFDMRFSNYPRFFWTALLAVAIYANFFSHHFLPDVRWLLVACTLVLFGRVRVYFTVDCAQRWMPLIVGGAAHRLLPVGGGKCRTATGTWLYPGRDGWHLVSLQKLGSWYLLLNISFVLVLLVNPPRPPEAQSRRKTRTAVALAEEGGA